jgi:hypothetical protein
MRQNGSELFINGVKVSNATQGMLLKALDEGAKVSFSPGKGAAKITLSRNLITGEAKKIVDACKSGELGLDSKVVNNVAESDLEILQMLQNLKEFDGDPDSERYYQKYVNVGVSSREVQRTLIAGGVTTKDYVNYKELGFTDLKDMVSLRKNGINPANYHELSNAINLSKKGIRKALKSKNPAMSGLDLDKDYTPTSFMYELSKKSKIL